MDYTCAGSWWEETRLVTTRRNGLHLFAHLAALAFPLLLILLGESAARGADPAIAFSDASEVGTFNVGAAHAEAIRSFDPSTDGAVMLLRYRLEGETAAGVWAKGF